ncbi:hypothetical protein [Spiroplasma mirum]|nr:MULTISPECIES: hypothetical protein [Spiroplasma]
MSRHENLNLTQAEANSFISHDSVNNVLSNREINLGNNHSFIKLYTLYNQWKNWFATASQDEFKDSADFIQKDD